jgi:hypothetical protein
MKFFEAYLYNVDKNEDGGKQIFNLSWGSGTRGQALVISLNPEHRKENGG